MSDVATLRMALVGYQIEKQRIEDRIREIQSELTGKHVAPPAAAAGKKAPEGKRILSPAARRRLSAGQKRRWAEHRKRLKAAARQT